MTTDIMFNKNDLGKKLYRKKTYYTLVIEQECLANSRAEATEKLSDCGIDHSQINHEITDANEGVETYMVDANYVESDDTKFIGKVKYDTDTYNQTLDEAIEAEDIHIDTWADEDEPHQLTKIKLVDTAKEESDVDVALNLEAERELGK